MKGPWVDVAPLRSSRAFRELWIGSSLGTVGGQLAQVAVLLQVWDLTRSPLWTGAVGLAGALPMLLFGLVGGVLADTTDRRALAALATAGQLCAAIGLAAQAFLHAGSAVLVLALVALSAACTALGSAARKTFPVLLLPGNQVAAGLALQNTAFQVAMLVGPALAGVVIAGRGLTAVYTLQALAVAASLLAVVRLPRMPRAHCGQDERGRGGGKRLRRPAPGGRRFLLATPTLSGSLATDLAATLLAMPISLFPLVNDARFGGDPRTLGLFLSSVAVGGICAGLLSGSYTRVRHAGRLQLAAAAVWGLALAGFGLVTPLWAALGCLALAGAADTVAVVTRGTLVQVETPDRFRGRVSSVEHVIGVAGPELGNFRGGAVASLTSAPFALVTGGLAAAAAVAVIAAVNRPLRRYRGPACPERPDDRTAADEREAT